MHLSIECHIILRQQNLELSTLAAVFINLTNMFNLVSWEELFNIINTNFPKLTPLTTLIYKTLADVHFKWNTSHWKSIAMNKGVNQGYPLSSMFATLVMNRVLEPINKSLRAQANNRLQNGGPGDNGYSGISHLFAWVNNLSSTIPHANIKFFLDQLKKIGSKRGCFINPEKSQILTSCSGQSINPNLLYTSTQTTYSINTYSHKKSNPQHCLSESNSRWISTTQHTGRISSLCQYIFQQTSPICLQPTYNTQQQHQRPTNLPQTFQHLHTPKTASPSRRKHHAPSPFRF
jgi:hypothetical protein